VLDFCGLRVLQKDTAKPVLLCLMGKCFVKCKRILNSQPQMLQLTFLENTVLLQIKQKPTTE
jgi:hypothetical protein